MARAPSRRVSALDALPRDVLAEHASHVAEAHKVTAARCRALGYERTAQLFERMAAACGEPARLGRASLALEGPALRVVQGGRAAEASVDEREPA